MMPDASSRPLVGLDFDNTIVLYDAVFREEGEAMGLLPAGFSGGKDAVRAHVRTRPDGAADWTRLQARVYGPGLVRARPAPGLFDFLAACRSAGRPVAIVSHKTEFAAADPDGTNLRDAARAWIAAYGLTDHRHGGIDPGRIHFESTRADKIARIASLGCGCFVDDLEEVFLEPDFPAGVDRILIKHGDVGHGDTATRAAEDGSFRTVRSWAEAAGLLFPCPDTTHRGKDHAAA